MPEVKAENTAPARTLRHRGRESQVLIYLGKQFRFFIYESDWKVLPLAAVIAWLVAMVIRGKFFSNMEGSLIGSFALTCVAIWNGCFNSIQSICRERAIVKREHRSGMHISSYVCAHMIYQLFLCLLQTGLTMYVLQLQGVGFPDKGFMTPWMIVDIGITMLLISYAADMMSLLISSIAHTTTGAMTVMPFVLIFQLVFSGGVIPLPSWVQPASRFTISSYGMTAIAAQSGYNELPMVTGWTTLEGMKDSEVGGTFTVGELVGLLDTKPVEKRRDMVVMDDDNLHKLLQVMDADVPGQVLLEKPIVLGNVIDIVRQSPFIEASKDNKITVKVTVGELFDLLGKEKVRDYVQTKTAEASRKPQYDRTVSNIVKNWLMIGVFILLFAAAAVISLELIDKDKR